MRMLNTVTCAYCFFLKRKSRLKGEYETELVFRRMQVQSLGRSVHRLLCSQT